MSWFTGKRVIVPFDFSSECIEAAKMALLFVERPDEVHIAHVLLQLPATDPLVIWDEHNEERRKATARLAIEAELSAAKINGVQVNVSIGNPGRVLADLATEIDAGLIIIPSHGYTGIKRWWLGSVAESVVQLAKCPVLVLKDKKT